MLLKVRLNETYMKVQTGAGTPAASDAARLGSEGTSRRYPPRRQGDDAAIWLRGTLGKIILEQRPRVPGWGILLPTEIVGEYTADDAYLLVVFDHRGQSHTERFTRDEIRQLQTDTVQATNRFKSLIASFCADA